MVIDLAFRRRNQKWFLIAWGNGVPSRCVSLHAAHKASWDKRWETGNSNKVLSKDMQCSATGKGKVLE